VGRIEFARLQQPFRFHPGFRLGRLLFQAAAAIVAGVQMQGELAFLSIAQFAAQERFESIRVAGVCW
jgi:hypothetical protein